MWRPFDLVTSYAATGLRLGAGWIANAASGPRPAQRIELYEFEACPFCRKVREAITQLDLEATIYPCPKRGPNYRPQVVERGGRSMFPYMVDPNTGDEMYESADIIDHLYRHYGPRKAPWLLKSDATVLLGSLASAVRPTRGTRYHPARRPEQPLELYAFEASPYCRIAREALCELELPYHSYSVGRDSPSRAAFVERSGYMMVPWLNDPNTDTHMFESADIRRYLYDTYAH